MRILLLDIRHSKGLTLQQLANISGISRSEINAIENEKVMPRIDTLELLAIALDCKIRDLIGSDYM